MKHNMPLVTIAATSYNQKDFILELIESVLAQTYENWELFISDNASTDATAEAVRQYGDSRIRFLQNETNIGQGRNIAKAYTLGSGEYKAVLGGDDYLHPQFIEKLVEALEANPEAAMAYTPATWVDEKSRPIKVLNHIGHPQEDDTACGRNNFADLLVFDNYITPCTALYRTKDLEKLSPVVRQTHSYDWDMHVRLAGVNNCFLFLKTPLACYRVHEGQDSSGYYQTTKPLEGHLSVLEKALEHPDAKALLGPRKEEIIQHLLRRYETYRKDPEAKKFESRIIALQKRLDALRDPLPRLKSKTPLVSVILTTYNRRQMLPDAIRSVLDQSYEHFELIVVNDAGESVADIVEGFGDSRIRLLELEENVGLPAARNRGIDAAKGEIFVYLDDDDLYRPNHLETIVKPFVHQRAEVVFVDALYVDEKIEEGRRTALREVCLFCDVTYSMERLHIQNFIPVNSFAHRREAFELVGRFDESLRSMEDWDFLLRLSRRFDFKKITEPTVEVRRRVDVEDNMLRQREAEFVEIYRRLYRRYDNLGNPGVEAKRQEVLRGLERKKRLAEGTIRQVAYLAHPFDDSGETALATQMVSGLLNAEDIELRSVWKRVGERYEMDEAVLAQAQVLLVQNRGALFNETVFRFRALGIPVVYLVDADYTALPVKNSHYSYYRALAPRIEEMMRASDRVVTASRTLQKMLAEQGVDAGCIEPAPDPNLWALPVQKTERETVHIGIVADEEGLDALQGMVSVLKEIRRRRKKEISIRVYGLNVPRAKLMAFSEYDPVRIQVNRYGDWIGYLRGENIDIALLPGRESAFSRSRSPLTLFELGLSQAAIVASDYAPYSDYLISGEEGILCPPRADAWVAAIERLIDDPGYRLRLANTFFAKIVTRYAPAGQAERFEELLEGLYAKPDSERRRGIETVKRSWKKYDIVALETYPAWLARRRFRQRDIGVWAREAEGWRALPYVTLFCYVDGETLPGFERTWQSLQNQIYPRWHLVVLSPLPAPAGMQAQERLDWVQSANPFFADVNTLVEGNPLEWIGVLRAGDMLEPDALSTFVQVMQYPPDRAAVYCDHGYIDAREILVDPQFKPDFSIDMLRAYDYIGRAFWVSKSALAEVGGFDAALGETATQDLFFRLYERYGREGVYHIDELLWHLSREGAESDEVKAVAAKVALLRHLKRLGMAADTVEGEAEGTLRPLYPLESEPLVSIIIPSKDRPELIGVCLDSLFEKTDYGAYEVIVVDNGSSDAEALAIYDRYAKKYPERFRIVDYDEPFNFSIACNRGAEAARGECLLFLNNDTQIVHENWLRILASYAIRPEAGAVGVRLLFPDGTIQHAGVGLGFGNVAAHLYGGEEAQVGGYMARLKTDQNYSAVTAAAVMIRREVFDRAGGFNGSDYRVFYSDIDLCLKIRDLGYEIVWTPHVTLIHHESKSINSGESGELAERRELFEADREVFADKWWRYLVRDPYHNRNLDIDPAVVRPNIDDQPRWNRFCRQTPKVWALPRGYDGGGYYRVMAPVEALDEASMIEGHIGWSYYGHAHLMLRHEPDVIVAQTPLHDYHIESLESLRKRFRGKIVFEIDDLLDNIPKDNPGYSRRYPDIKERLKKAVGLSDRLVVSTEPLKKAYGKLAKESIIVPNRLRKEPWLALSSQRGTGKKPRVGWAGSPFHTGDLKVIQKAVHALRDRVEWVFMGLVPEGCEGDVHEYHPPVSLDAYPAKLASLNLDLALVPLQVNAFNEAKSNLRLLEMGILGWPVVATDIFPYQNAPVTLVPNKPDAWIAAIEAKLADMEATYREGDRLKAWVLEHFILEDHLEEIVDAYR